MKTNQLLRHGRGRRHQNWERRAAGLAALFVCALVLTACTGLGPQQLHEGDISLDEVPAYSGEPYVEINGGRADFTDEEMVADAYESYSDLDDLGRCGTAEACAGEELMPTAERERISEVHPTGWHRDEYDFIEGELLYNRCHLLAYSLTAENANEKNLITGTRYMNTEGMEPFESMTAGYIHRTGNHVMYRVTPIFKEDNLVASGVHMMAKSVEDDGEGLEFNIYCYNVQPGVSIDYATGDNWLSTETLITEEDVSGTYILNTNSMKFHRPSCPGVVDMNESNREEYKGSRAALIEQGYEPCGSCRP